MSGFILQNIIWEICIVLFVIIIWNPVVYFIKGIKLSIFLIRNNRVSDLGSGASKHYADRFVEVFNEAELVSNVYKNQVSKSLI